LRIRAFEPGDLPAVADLYASVVRGEDRASEGLRQTFESLLLHGPQDPELPSLVAENGKLIGHLGVYPRTFSFEGAPIRAAVSAQLVTDPESRRFAPGLQLTRRFLEGPQDLSIADGATYDVRRMWEALGGETYHLACIRWTRILSPFRFLGRTLGRRPGVAGRLATWLPLWAVLDVVGRRLPPSKALPPEDYAEPVALTEESLVADLPGLMRHMRLRPQYDPPFARWLFRSLGAVRARGALHAWIVPGERGPRGCFVYYLGKDRIATVMQVLAPPASMDVVFDHLIEHARRQGAVAVQGRVEPACLPSVARHRSVLQYPDALVLVHARRAEITHAIQNGRGGFARLDGEYWMSPHLEVYE
jgi:hypothetical protein